MNAKRRKTATDILAQIEELASQLEFLKDDQLFELKEAEQEAFDNLPESIQASEKGQLIEEIAGKLFEAYDALEQGVDYLQECITNFRDALEA